MANSGLQPDAVVFVVFGFRRIDVPGGAVGAGSILVDSRTGMLVVSFDTAGRYAAELQAEDLRPAGSPKAMLYIKNWTFAVQVADKPAAASGSAGDPGDGDTVAVAAGLGSVVGLMLVLLVGFKVQVYLLKHRPVDVSAMQHDLMESLGLVATTDIGRREVGISLLLDTAVADAAGVGGELPPQLRAELVAALSKAVPQLRQAMQGARVTSPGGSSKRVLVVLQQQSIKGAATVERAVEDLARKAGRGKLLLAPHHTVVDAIMAVPQRVPREVPRSALTRLKLLGEGAFGEVHKYQLDERGAAMAVFVAAKSIKAGAKGGAEARQSLLQEAALGALLHHRNVVTTVGISTAPRDVPALLLLEYYAEGTLEDHCSAPDPGLMAVSERLTYCAQVTVL